MYLHTQGQSELLQPSLRKHEEGYSRARLRMWAPRLRQGRFKSLGIAPTLNLNYWIDTRSETQVLASQSGCRKIPFRGSGELNRSGRAMDNSPEGRIGMLSRSENTSVLNDCTQETRRSSRRLQWFGVALDA